MSDLDFSAYPGDARPAVDVRFREDWHHGNIESWQRLGDDWWATVTFGAADGTERRTTVPQSQLRLPTDRSVTTQVYRRGHEPVIEVRTTGADGPRWRSCYLRSWTRAEAGWQATVAWSTPSGEQHLGVFCERDVRKAAS